METDINSDDLFVVIVGDGDDEDVQIDTTDLSQFENVKIKEEMLDETTGVMGVEDIFHTVELYGEYLEMDIKQIVKEEPQEIEYLDYKPSDDDDEDYVPNTIDDDNGSNEDDDYDDEAEIKVIKRRPPKGNKNKTRRDGRRFSMVKPGEEKSLVNDLRNRYPDLKTNQNLMIETLAEIMRTVKPPEPPKDYYRVNGSNFECVECNRLTESVPAASRHYQEYHGPRYLFCYACGVDFRSKTNLYKHEKSCNAPDATVVLKARGMFVGNKGRSRPFIQRFPMAHKKELSSPVRTVFSCHQCSATFFSKQALLSHSYLHEGRRPYPCSVCPCAYTSYSALSRHFNKHTDVQFICDYCARSFKLKTALVAHIDTHLPAKKHRCEECGKGFSQKSGMLLHVHRAHRHLPPPCACPICPKRFRRMSLLKIHMKEAHGMLLMTRKMFFRSLPTMTNDQLDKAKIVFKRDVANCNKRYEKQGQFATFIADKEVILTEDTDNNNDLTEDHFEVEVAGDNAENGELPESHCKTEVIEDNVDAAEENPENIDTADNFDSSEEYLYTEVVGDDTELSKEHIQTEVTEVNADSSEDLSQTEDTENNVVSEELVQYIEQAQQEGSSGDVVKVVCIENGKLVQLTANDIHVYQASKHEGTKLIQAIEKQPIDVAPIYYVQQPDEEQAISTPPKCEQQVDKGKLRFFRKKTPKEMPVQLVKTKKTDITKNVHQIQTTKANTPSAKAVQIIETRTQVVPKGGQGARLTRNRNTPNVILQSPVPRARRYVTTNTTPNEPPKVKEAKRQETPKRQRFFLRNVRKNTTPNVNVTVEVMETDTDNTAKETETVGVKNTPKAIQQKQSVDTESVIKRIGSGITVTRKSDDKKDVTLKRRQNVDEVMVDSSYKGRLRKVRKGPSMPEL